MAQAAGGFPLIQELVQQRKYYWSDHVGQQVDAGEFDEADLEACILSGSVKKTERDRLGNSVGKKVYVVVGRDARGRQFYTAGKILRSNGQLYFFITAHQAR